MASSGKSYQEMLGRWKVMVTSLGPQLGTIPELSARHARLSQLMAQAEELEARQAQLRADLQEVNGRRRELAKVGEELRNRIGAVLRAEHGFTSERLLEFALKRKHIRSRSRKTNEEPEAAAAAK
jgi:predicted  nucleic acid-binding Zn-ribbon protein